MRNRDMTAGVGETSDHMDLKHALGHFMTGVAVVTTNDHQNRPRGLTANSLASVSLDPPLILVCIGETSSSFDIFQTVERFAVNVLSDNQRDHSTLFASNASDKFQSISWQMGETGSPLLTAALAWYECAVYDRVLAGDHVILIGRILRFKHCTGQPLGYFRGDYVTLKGRDEIGDHNSAKQFADVVFDAERIASRPQAGCHPPANFRVGDDHHAQKALGAERA